MNVKKIVKSTMKELGPNFFKNIYHSPEFNGLELVKKGISQDDSSNLLIENSKIVVNHSSAAIIVNHLGSGEIIKNAGEYIYPFDSLKEPLTKGERIVASILSDNQILNKLNTHIYYLNLREILGIKFGSLNQVTYYDSFYHSQLGIRLFGEISIKVVDVNLFISNYLENQVDTYTLQEHSNRKKMAQVILKVFAANFEKNAHKYAYSYLNNNLNYWWQYEKETINDMLVISYGFCITDLFIENFEYGKDSQALIEGFNEKFAKEHDFRWSENIDLEYLKYCLVHNIEIDEKKLSRPTEHVIIALSKGLSETLVKTKTALPSSSDVILDSKEKLKKISGRISSESTKVKSNLKNNVSSVVHGLNHNKDEKLKKLKNIDSKTHIEKTRKKK